jgi:hypothetical protein
MTIHQETGKMPEETGQTESWEADACLKQEDEAAKGEPARQAMRNSW